MLKKLLILVALAGVGALVAKKLLGGSESDEWEDIEAWEAPQYPPVSEAAESASEAASEAKDAAADAAEDVADAASDAADDAQDAATEVVDKAKDN